MTGMTQQAEPDLNEEPAGYDEGLASPGSKRLSRRHWSLVQ